MKSYHKTRPGDLVFECHNGNKTGDSYDAFADFRYPYIALHPNADGTLTAIKRHGVDTRTHILYSWITEYD